MEPGENSSVTTGFSQKPIAPWDSIASFRSRGLGGFAPLVGSMGFSRAAPHGRGYNRPRSFSSARDREPAAGRRTGSHSGASPQVLYSTTVRKGAWASRQPQGEDGVHAHSGIRSRTLA